MKLKLHGNNWEKWEKLQHNTHQNKNPIFITLTKQQNADDVQKQHTPLFYFLISADAVQVLQQKKLHSFWWTCQFEADQKKQQKKTFPSHKVPSANLPVNKLLKERNG